MSSSVRESGKPSADQLLKVRVGQAGRDDIPTHRTGVEAKRFEKTGKLAEDAARVARLTGRQYFENNKHDGKDRGIRDAYRYGTGRRRKHRKTRKHKKTHRRR